MRGGLVVSDVDGVVLDFYKGAARVLEDMLGRRMVKVDDRPATKHRYGLTDAQYQQMRVVMQTHPHGWGNLPVLPGAVEAIQRLNRAGHPVIFLSSCGQSLYDLRRANLDRIGLAHCELICVEDKDKNAKGEVLDQLNPIAFIDDHMKMLIQASRVPHRVWIDHGCSLETDPEGRPWVETHQVHQTPSLADWVDGWVPRVSEMPTPAVARRRPVFA